MADHPVKKKLRSEILPYIASARRLRRQWFYRLHGLFGYATDTVVALSGIGVTVPLVGLLAGGAAPDQAAPTDGATLNNALAGVPAWLYFPTLVLVVGWIVLRVGFHREDGQKRAVLARSCMRTMTQAEARLHRILLKSDPMPELTTLVDELIAPTVDRNIQEQAWPWAGPDPSVDDEVDLQLADLCRRFEENWAPGPTIEMAAGGLHG